MLRKAVLSTLLIGLIGVLVAGAIIRTVDKTENVAEARGQGQGRGTGQEVGYAALQTGRNLDADIQSNGRGGNGQGAGTVERLYPNYEEAPEEWVLYEGTVVQAPTDGVDLVIETHDGEQVVVGTGPGYMEDQGFSLQAGEQVQVQVQGYWEDDELKAAQVTRLRDGETITLRDEIGRPAWAGGGQNAQADARSGYGGQGRTEAPSAGISTGQAEVDEWLALQGTAVSVDSNTLIVQTDDGQEIVAENRAWWFAQEQGFSVQLGDQVTLTGFYEGDDFETGQFTNVTTGQTVSIREEGGRPLWAGRGRRG